MEPVAQPKVLLVIARIPITDDAVLFENDVIAFLATKMDAQEFRIDLLLKVHHAIELTVHEEVYLAALGVHHIESLKCLVQDAISDAEAIEVLAATLEENLVSEVLALVSVERIVDGCAPDGLVEVELAALLCERGTPSTARIV